MLKFLFATTQENLPSALKNLAREDIESLCDESIYYRGKEYYNAGAINDISYSGTKELTASVQGSQLYEVTLQLDDGRVCASCSCPYEDTCKHLVAVLLHTLLENIENSNMTAPNAPGFSDYLKTLSKKELVALVERFAPKAFRTVIQNQFISPEKSAPMVGEVIKKIDQALYNDELYYDPADMEAALEKQLQKLKGLGEKEAETIYHLIVAMITRLNALLDEGWLYDSYQDAPFDDVFLNEFARNFLRPLPLSQKIKYIDAIEPVIKNSEYSYFQGILDNLEELFEEKDLLALKDMLLKNLADQNVKNAEAYYMAIEPKLSLDEKSFILNRIHHLSATLSMSLAKVLEQEGRIAPAIEALAVCSEKPDFWTVKKTVFNELLRLKHLNESLDLDFADHMLTELADKKTLIDLKNHFPDKKHHFEEVLRKKSALQLLEYFEDEKRLDEALEIIMNNDIMEHTRYLFFKKYKTAFSKKAKAYFINRINENLVDSGNHYYERIVDTLNALMTIDVNKANEIKAMIKQNYKRRSKLMAMLSMNT